MWAWACRNTYSLPELKPINEAVIRGMDSLYMIDLADTLSIFPQISFTQDTAFSDPSRYRYEWIYIVRPTSGHIYDYRTISTDKSLVDYVLADDISPGAGVYEFAFRVVDTYTDTFTEFPFRVILGNAYYEGWVVLNDVQGKARVDMISYHPPTDTFVYLRDVIPLSGQTTETGSKPVFLEEVYGMHNELVSGGILMGTAQGITAFSSVDLTNVYDYFQQYAALSRVPDSARRSPRFWGTIYNQYLQLDGAFYECYESDYQQGSFRRFTYIQAPDGSLQPFRAAPYMAMNLKEDRNVNVAVLFNEDRDEFVWYSEQDTYCTPLTAVNAFDHGSSWSLVYLAHTHASGGHYVAVLRETTTGDLYYLKFTPYALVEFTRVAPESGLYKTHDMTLNPKTGKLYFAIGKSLFAYSTSEEQKLTDFDGEITMLKFKQYLLLVEFMTGATVNKDRYQRYEEMLLVATYDETQPDDSGVLKLYDLSKNQLFQQFSGFAKIVDVTYKER